jgi:RecA/RadA recombinase
MTEELDRAIRRLRMKTVRKFQGGDTEKQLDKTLKEIAKQYGNDMLTPVSLIASRHDVQCVATNFQPLDDILSGQTERVDGLRVPIVGSGRGVPRSRIIEIFGPESSGKTTLCLTIVAAFQERGFACAYIDAEHAMDMDYADRLGCDTDL